MHQGLPCAGGIPCSALRPKCTDAMCAVCNDVTCVMLVVHHGFKLPRVSAHMAETCTETDKIIKRI